jgi:hypothetical protein
MRGLPVCLRYEDLLCTVLPTCSVILASRSTYFTRNNNISHFRLAHIPETWSIRPIRTIHISPAYIASPSTPSLIFEEHFGRFFRKKKSAKFCPIGIGISLDYCSQLVSSAHLPQIGSLFVSVSCGLRVALRAFRLKELSALFGVSLGNFDIRFSDDHLGLVWGVNYTR